MNNRYQPARGQRALLGAAMSFIAFNAGCASEEDAPKSAEGFVTASPASALPAEARCWMGEPETPSPGQHVLRCDRGELEGLRTKNITVNIMDAAGDKTRVQLAYLGYAIYKYSSKDGFEDIDPNPDVVDVVTLSDAAFPITVSVEAQAEGFGQTAWRANREGAVVGLDGDDPFLDAPFGASATFASPGELTAESPMVVTLPFALWKVTLRTDAIDYGLQLDPYFVTVETGWNGLLAGEPLDIAGELPDLSANDEQGETYFYIPVDASVSAVTGTMGNGEPFEIRGPGAYEVNEAGITLVSE